MSTSRHFTNLELGLLGTKLRLRRLELGLSVEDLATRLGVAASYVKRRETSVPRTEKDDGIWEDALNVDRGWLRSDIDRNVLATARSAKPDENVASGWRARMHGRRNFLFLSIEDLSERTGIHAEILRRFENALPESTHLDQFIEDGLCVRRGWIREANTAGGPGAFRLMNEVSGTVVDDISDIARWATKTPTGRPGTPQKIEMVLRRYGVHGEENTTWEGIGALLGLRKQGVQQAVATVLASAVGKGIYSNALQALALAVEPFLPESLERLAERVRHLLGPVISIENANRFAIDFLGKPFVRVHAGVAFSVSDIPALPGMERPRGEPEFGAERSDKAATYDLPLDGSQVRKGELHDLILSTSRELIRRSWAAHVPDVIKVVTNKAGIPVTVDAVMYALKSNADFDWLDEKAQWFWFGAQWHSAVYNWLMKMMLAAEQELTLKELVDGLTRCRMRNDPSSKVAPQSVLKTILSRQPDIEFGDKGGYQLVEEAYESKGGLLSQSERLLVAALRIRGGRADRQQLVSDLVDSGLMKMPSFDANLTYSPVLRPLGGAQWSYVGARIRRGAPTKARRASK